MPRWPAGLHPHAAGQPSRMSQQGWRIPSTRQRFYWRHTDAILDQPLPLVVVNSAGQAASMAGPQGVGERWAVHQVQVWTSSQLGAVPYVIQQAEGVPIPPPPPILAQIWLTIAGQQIHQLGQTTMAGQDGVGVNWVPIEVGEQIAVVWYGAEPGDTCQALLRGIKTVLDT